MLTADADWAEITESRGSTLLHSEITQAILGAFYSVYSEVGFGFLESVYEKCLAIVLDHAGLKVERQVPYQITFRGRSAGTYRADLVVESKVIVEVKAGHSIIPQHLLQVRNYLKASELHVGLVLNFGEKPEFRRVVWTRDNPR